MRLEEAATILGISLDEITLDSLKQSYRKLSLLFDPEKSKDEATQVRHREICEAYQKLITIMEGSDSQRGEDSHEVAAFMRMFMDMVGISDNEPVPAAMTFGMMFGNRKEATEEWSTDEDGDEDYNDDDDDDDDEDDDDDDNYLSDDYYEECEHQRAAASAAIDNVMESMDMPVWEAQAKQYSNMDLKEQASKERLFEIIDQQSGDDDDDYDDDECCDEDEGDDSNNTSSAAEDRKQRLAKKKADKRRKQKVKKNVLKVEEAANIKVSKDMMSKTIEAELNTPEAKRLISMHKDHIKSDLIASVYHGQLSKVTQILGYDFTAALPPLISMRIAILIKMELPNYLLLHKCISDLSLLYDDIVRSSTADCNVDGTARVNTDTNGGNSDGSSEVKRRGTPNSKSSEIMALAARRLEVARYLMRFQNPSLNLGILDLDGLTVLHLAILCSDLNFTKLVLNTLTSDPLHRGELNLNSRCQKRGWSPLHYAVDRCDINSIRMLIQSGASISTMSTAVGTATGPGNGKTVTNSKITPLDLAKRKLQVATAAAAASTATKSSSQISCNNIKNIYEYIVEELLLAVPVNSKRKASPPKNDNKTEVVKDNSHSSDRPVDMTVNPFAPPKPAGTVQNNDNASDSNSTLTAPTMVVPAPVAPTPVSLSSTSPATQKVVRNVDNAISTTATSSVTPAVVNSVVSSAVGSKGPAAEVSSTKKGKKNKKGSVSIAANAPVMNTVPASAKATSDVGFTTSKSAPVPQNESVNVKAKVDVVTTAKTITAPPSSTATKKGNVGSASSSSSPTQQQNANQEEHGSAASGAASAVPELSVASRDEMVDRLLAMGFREPDCLAAIVLYGVDIDRAISWLCEKPLTGPSAVPTTTTTVAVPTTTANKLPPSGGNAVTVKSKKEVAKSTVAATKVAPVTASVDKNTVRAASPIIPVVKTAPTPVKAPSPPALLPSATENKLLKDKEEQRRINKAWNEAKVEEERKKAEQQRKQAEDDAREAMLAKALQAAEQLRLQQQATQNSPAIGGLFSTSTVDLRQPPSIGPPPLKPMPSLLSVSSVIPSVTVAPPQPATIVPSGLQPTAVGVAPAVLPLQQQFNQQRQLEQQGILSQFQQQQQLQEKQQREQQREREQILLQQQMQQHLAQQQIVQQKLTQQQVLQQQQQQFASANNGGNMLFAPQLQQQSSPAMRMMTGGNGNGMYQQPIPVPMHFQQQQQHQQPQHMLSHSASTMQIQQQQQWGRPPMPPDALQQHFGYGHFQSHVAADFSNRPHMQQPSQSSFADDSLLFDEAPVEAIVDGALELSAGAKPFVPRSAKIAAFQQPVSVQQSPLMSSHQPVFDGMQPLMQGLHFASPQQLSLQQHQSSSLLSAGMDQSWLLSAPSLAGPSSVSGGGGSNVASLDVMGGDSNRDFMSEFDLLPSSLGGLLDDDNFDFGAILESETST